MFERRCAQRRSPTCSQRLAAVRLLYLGVQAVRLEALVLHVDAKCHSGAGLGFLILGLVLGIGSHIASLAALGGEHVARPRTVQHRRRKPAGTAVTDQRMPADGSTWLQPLVVPLSMAGLVLEFLSGAPTAALSYGRVLAVLLLLSIVLQRDPLRQALPQLAAALALDCAAFLLAALTGRYDTPRAIVIHLTSTMAAALAVVVLMPLYAGPQTPPPPGLPPSDMWRATPHAQQEEGEGKGPAAAELLDPTALDRPLGGLPPDVVQCSERHLLSTFRRRVCLERVASAALIMAGVVRGSAAGGLGGGGASFAAAQAAMHPPPSPLLRARMAAANLAAVTAATLLLLNGLMARLPGRLYGEHATPINSVVTALHALGHVLQVLAFAPRQRSRAMLVRMMAALTANLVGNEDPWVIFLAQLLALLGVVTALDSWLWWGGAAPGVGALSAGGSGGGGGVNVLQLHAALTADLGTGGGGGGVAAAEAAGSAHMLPWLRIGQRLGIPQVARSCLPGASAAMAAPPAAAAAVATAIPSLRLLPFMCYSLIAVTGALVWRSLYRGGKYLEYYRLYRKFYLPASYGGTCITAPVPHEEVMRLRDGQHLRGDHQSPSSSSSNSTARAIAHPLQRQSTEISQTSVVSPSESIRRRPTRRSVSLNTFMGVGGSLGGGALPAGGGAGGGGGGSGHGHSLRVGGVQSLASTLSSAASERIAHVAATVAAAAAVPPEAPGGGGAAAAAAAAADDPLRFALLNSGYSPFGTASGVSSLEQPRMVIPISGGGGGAAAGQPAGGTPYQSGAVLESLAEVPEPSSSGGVIDSSTRPLLASALEMDEADVISGKINVTRQLSKLAALGGGGGGGGGGGMGARGLLDPYGQPEDLTPSRRNSISAANPHSPPRPGYGATPAEQVAAAAAAFAGAGGAGRHHPPVRKASSRRSVDTSYTDILTGPSQPYNLPSASALPEEGRASLSGAGSILESVAACLASEDFSPVAGGVSSGSPGGGQDRPASGGHHARTHRLRGPVARASSDLAAGFRSPHLGPHLHPAHPLHHHYPAHPLLSAGGGGVGGGGGGPFSHHGAPQSLQQQLQQQPTLQQPQPYLPLRGALPQHRLPRRSPSDVSHLARGVHPFPRQLPGGHMGLHAHPPTVATSRYAPSPVNPSSYPAHRTSAVQGGGGAAAGAVSSAAATATAMLSGGGGGGEVPRAASFSAAASPAAAGAGGRGYTSTDRRGPSRQTSRQQGGWIDSTGLMLLGQNLITIGGSSGGHNVMLTSLQSPHISGINLGPGEPSAAGMSTAAAAALSGEFGDPRKPAAAAGLDPAAALLDADPFGAEAVSSLEPARGLAARGRWDGGGGGGGGEGGNLQSKVAPFLFGGVGPSGRMSAAGSGQSPRAGLAAESGVQPGLGTAAAAAAVRGRPALVSTEGGARPGAGAGAGAGAAAEMMGEGPWRRCAAEAVGSSSAAAPPPQQRQPSQVPHVTAAAGLNQQIAAAQWQMQRQQNQQHQHQHPQQSMQAQLEPPQPSAAHSEAEPQQPSGSLSFRRQRTLGLVSTPSAGTLGSGGGGGGGGAAAAAVVSGDASSLRLKMRVSWSDMEARGSGGSTGTTTLLTTASEASKTSTAGIDPVAGSTYMPLPAAGTPHSGSGNGGSADGTAAPEQLPELPAPGGGGAAAGAEAEDPEPGRPGRPLPAQPQGPLHPQSQQQQQQQQPRNAVRPLRIHSAYGALGADSYHGAYDGPRGSGEPSETSVMVEMEHVRAAKELAAMWTSSSVGDWSSQMGPSTQSSFAAAPPPHAAAVVAAAAQSPKPPSEDAGGGAVLGQLSVVQEMAESSPALAAAAAAAAAAEPGPAAERRGSTRQRRLSHVMSHVPPLGGARLDSGRAAQQPQPPSAAATVAVAATPAAAPSAAPTPAGKRAHGGVAPGSHTGGAAPRMPSGPTAASLREEMGLGFGVSSGGLTGGSASSVAGGASTAMSFDNWATADDLAAMLLGPAAAGDSGGRATAAATAATAAVGGAVGGPEVTARLGSSSRRPIASRGPTPGQSPMTTPAQAPHAVGLEVSDPGPGGRKHPRHPQTHAGGGSRSGVSASGATPAPRVPVQRQSSWMGSGPGPGPGSRQREEDLRRAAGRFDRQREADGRRGWGFAAGGDYVGGEGPGPGAAAGGGGAAAGSSAAAGWSQNSPSDAADRRASAAVAAARMPRDAASSTALVSSPPDASRGLSPPAQLWGAAGRVMPLRSPSVPNMGGNLRGMQYGSVRRTSSMGKSRLGSMSSASSSTLCLLNATGASTPPSASQHTAGQLGLSAPAGAGGAAAGGARRGAAHLQQPGQVSGRESTSGAAAAAGAPLTVPPGWEDAMASYAGLPPMRASQTQLALSLPASSLRGSVVGGKAAGAAVLGDGSGGGGGGGSSSIARGLAAAGATVSGPVGWAQDARQQPLRRPPFRRASLDERLFKQVVIARLPGSPPAGTAAPRNARGRRRSVGSFLASEYIPSRLSQDGKAAARGVGAAPLAPGGAGGAAKSPLPGPAAVATAGPAAMSPAMPGMGGLRQVVRQRSLSAVPELDVLAMQGLEGAPGMAPSAGGPGGPVGLSSHHHHQQQMPLGTVDNRRPSVAGSVATAVTASSASLQSFADVALGGVNYF